KVVAISTCGSLIGVEGNKNLGGNLLYFARYYGAVLIALTVMMSAWMTRTYGRGFIATRTVMTTMVSIAISVMAGVCIRIITTGVVGVRWFIRMEMRARGATTISINVLFMFINSGNRRMMRGVGWFVL